MAEVTRALVKDLQQFKEVDLSTLTLDEIRKIDKGTWEPAWRRISADLRPALKRSFSGKDEVVDVLLWSLVSQLPLLILGRWGTGKSLVVRTLASFLGVQSRPRPIREEDAGAEELKKKGRVQERDRDHFEYLLTRFTTPEELLGALETDLLLQHGVHMRRTQGLLPRARIVFLDEVFKANSAILNALLSITNERLFYNAGQPWRVNVQMLIGASNEEPSDPELGAFYDRFPVRVVSHPVSGAAEVEGLLQLAHKHLYRSRFGNQERIEPRACLNDVLLMSAISITAFSDEDGGLRDEDKEFRARFVRFFQTLREEFGISDRSCHHFYRLACARALLSDNKPRTHLDPSDLVVFRYSHASDAVAARVDRLLGR